MLILAKSALSLMLGFIISMVVGIIFIPCMKRIGVGQQVSHSLEKHLKKEGTPTMGGFIFIIGTILAIICLWLYGSLEITSNILIVLVVFLSYGALGFADDYLKVRYKNNKGLSRMLKLLIQTLIALVFFYIYVKDGGKPTIDITFLNLHLNLGWTYGLFILFLLVGSSNAVNITDGLDGLAGGLSAIAFAAYGIIAWSTSWLAGYTEIAIFSFILVGSLLGFLLFNSHPAKVFMGDTGSMALGATLAAIAILTRHEISLAVIGGVFVIETLSTLIQIIAIRKFHKRVFKKAPLHHHFEELGWQETDIVKTFWVVGLILAMLMITYGVWL
ncbi:MAG: phospho-N-acetylmuramoyl-pentapeptide-transferase [Firmicutes bacterium]|nr:phospho-N-acetylmuramoyl-pentapeptide-transferase [Bacillota bacterium]